MATAKKPTAGKATASQVKSANYLGVAGLNPTGEFAKPTPVAPKPTAKPKATPTAPSASQDYYASTLGRYLGGVGPAPTAPTTPAVLQDPSTSQVTMINMANGPITIDSAGENVAPFMGRESFGPGIVTPAKNTGTTGRELAAGILRSRGVSDKIINSSLDFLDEIKFDFGVDAAGTENAITVLLYSPDYTTKAGKKLSSPYYNMYGKFAKYTSGDNSDPRVLTGLIDDFRALPKAYGLSEEFGSDATIEKAFQNKVDLATLDKRYAQAQVAALVADPFVVESAKQQGFINNTKDLTAFYADAGIGEAQMQRNKIQNALGAETLRQGMKINAANLAKTAGELQLRKVDEGTAAANAAKDMSTVAEQLQPITTYSGVYEGKLAGTTEQIQQELVSEQSLGQASQRRKRVEAMNNAAYQGRSGTTNVSLSKSIQL